MSLLAWASRRAGGLAMVMTILLCYWALSVKTKLPSRLDPNQDLRQPQQHQWGLIGRLHDPGIWTGVFAYYCLLIHVLVSIFPLRACWAISDLVKNIKKVTSVDDALFFQTPRHSRDSSLSSEILTPPQHDCSISGGRCGVTAKELCFSNGGLGHPQVIHAIVIPNYKEVVDTLRETLEILSSHPQARYTYDVYLAVEQREENVEHKALSLVSDFVKSFRSIDFIVHPYGILGESAGKGSNIAWAARRLSERYSMGIRPDVIVTGIDVDSHLSSRYFSLITSMHISHPETANTTMYSAPMIFDRNAHLVPAVVRVADILWCAAGLSGLYSSSTIAPPTSVYSLPLQLVDRVGGWDCHSEAIGEDLHMYLKCFFALNGNLTVRTVCSPVSQCNVTGGGRGKGLFGVAIDMRARYRQALRHMWGSLDTGYALRKTVELWLDRKQTSRVFRPLHSSLNNVLKDYVPRTQLRGPGSEEAALEGGIFSDIVQDTLMKPNYKRLFYLFHRLFEAHFLPVQMAILIVASTLYEWRTADGTDIYLVASILKVCKILRVLGFLEVAFYLCLYEAYHEVCVAAREKEATISGLATNMNFSRRSPRKNFIDYIMLPLVAPLYGVIPCAHAQIFHFWTLELIYTVSQKAVRRRIKPVSVDEVV